MAENRAASRGMTLAAFAAVYVIWGSTYLAIRYAIESLPSFLMASARFLVAGAILYAFVRWRGVPAPSRQHWISSLRIGALLLLVGNGAVVWAEHRIPSGIAALLVAVEPLWIVVLDWARRGGKRPAGRTMVGVVLGFAGLLILVGPDLTSGTAAVDLLGAGVVVIGALSWAVGSLYSRHAPLPESPFLATAMQMLSGGALLLVAGVVSGEAAALDPSAFTGRSLAALAYLTVFGSLVAFTAYTWLLGVVSPARASTYAYVNPLVAVILGWALASEALTMRVAVSAVVIVAAVALITSVGETVRESMPEGAPAGHGGVPLPEAAGRVHAPRARRSWVRRIRS